MVEWQESITEMYWERINIIVIFSRVSDVCGYFLSFKNLQVAISHFKYIHTFFSNVKFLLFLFLIEVWLLCNIM